MVEAVWQRRLLFLALAIGFLTLFVEVRYEHRFAVLGYATAWIPLVVSAVLAAISLAMAFARQAWLAALAVVLFGVGMASGVAGVYFHTELEPERFESLIAGRTVSSGEGDDAASWPPSLAPMGLSGLALIGILLSAPDARRRAKGNDAA